MNDQSRPGESGSDKTIAAVNTILPNAADSASLAIPVITDGMSQPDIAVAITAAGM